MKSYNRGWLLIATPCVLGFLLFYIVPFGYSIYYSVLDGAATREYVGFANFMNVLSNDFFKLAITNTIIFIAVDVPLLLCLSMSIALLMYNGKLESNLLRAALILPLLLPSVAVTPLFEKLSYIISESFAVHAIFIWKYTGLFVLVFLSARNTILKEYYEAASIDGAGSFRMFANITLPLLLPSVLFATVLGIVYNLRIFKEAYLMFGAYPDESVYLTQHYMNNQFNKLNYPLLTSGGLSFAIMLMIPVFIGFIIIRRRSKRV